MWCIPKVTQEFEERMFDVLDVYAKTYDPRYPVVCLDEKTHQLLSTPRGGRLPAFGKPERVDYEYKRHGTVNHFVAVSPRGGKRHIRVTDRRTALDFAAFMQYLIMQVYKKAEKVCVVLDNLNIHGEKAIMETYGQDLGGRICTRIEWHHTPKHASWLNMAEIEIGVLQRNVLSKRIGVKEELVREIAAYQRRRNRESATINWQFTREKAKEVFKLRDN